MYRSNERVFDKFFRELANIVHDRENILLIDLGDLCIIKPNVKKAVGMYFKHQELLDQGKISQETFDKYQNVVINVLKYANISLDSGSDSQHEVLGVQHPERDSEE